MGNQNIPVEEIEKDLNLISEEGIDVDRKQLKKDMCTQFTDKWEWIREYCVNASDALASQCTIRIEELEDRVRITIKDDGHGMDKENTLSFMTVFKSVKTGDPEKIVGCHGVGKLSPFAIAALKRYAMTTSTGKECWELETGSLLDDIPVTLNRIEPVPSQGTRFTIEFDKTHSYDFILGKARQILRSYCQYLDMQIFIEGKSLEDTSFSKELINEPWYYGPETMPKIYQEKDFGKKYEVILGINRGTHSVYQNRVLVSNSYNLITIGGTKGLYLSGLDIRVNSTEFNLNFGRNKLTNEGMLKEISSTIRKRLFPNYFNQLAELYTEGGIDNIDIGYAQIEALACGILNYDTRYIYSATQLPMFRLRNRSPLSFAEIKAEVNRTGKIYLENADTTGVDFTVYDGPVLSLNQPSGGLDLLKKYFSEAMINLGLTDVVLEHPLGSGRKLGPKEQAFEKRLGFSPQAIEKQFSSRSKNKFSGSSGTKFTMALHEEGFLDKVCEESKEARDDLEHLKWKVNYLVDRDGKTPNQTHRFLQKDGIIILNLNHPEIQQLLDLSEYSPNLAGHWAMAICLCEGNAILKHLTPEAREDLLIVDAMSRCGQVEQADGSTPQDDEFYETNDDFDFELNNIDLWF